MIARENAERWNVLENGVFVCGFSAGGHLAGTVSTMWDDPAFYAEFESYNMAMGLSKDSAPWRPDGAVLGYPVMTMLDFTHEGSRDALCGKEDTKLHAALSLENRVTEKTAPVFLFHTGEDGCVPAENSLQYVAELRKYGVPFELHVFEKGGHGLSLCNELTAVYDGQIVPENTPWIGLAVTWIKGRTSK